MTSIFVAKLDFGFDSEQLRELFEQYGKVLKASVATDRETGKSRGFGFVEMDNREEALKAISALDNFAVNGRPIAVKEAEDRGAATRPTFEKKPYAPNNVDFPTTQDVDALPSLEISKIEPRKKLNNLKDRKSPDSEGKNKKPKMDAYKKSGKPGKFFDDDDLDELDDDLFSYKRNNDDLLDEDED
jgi:RNA recognition motif-containing protein